MYIKRQTSFQCQPSLDGLIRSFAGNKTEIWKLSRKANSWRLLNIKKALKLAFYGPRKTKKKIKIYKKKRRRVRLKEGAAQQIKKRVTERGRRKREKPSATVLNSPELVTFLPVLGPNYSKCHSTDGGPLQRRALKPLPAVPHFVLPKLFKRKKKQKMMHKLGMTTK